MPAASVKDGTAMVRGSVVVSVRDPDFPVMVRLYCPTAAELLVVSVRVSLYPDPVMGFGEKDTVTPLGRPDAESVTLPVNPFREFTET